MLKNPDFSKPFQLQTNASDVGVGAVLSQGGDQDQPIAYFDRKILDRERNYSTIEKECLAIVLGIKAFATYLVGKRQCRCLIKTSRKSQNRPVLRTREGGE